MVRDEQRLERGWVRQMTQAVDASSVRAASAPQNAWRWQSRTPRSAVTPHSTVSEREASRATREWRRAWKQTNEASVSRAAVVQSARQASRVRVGLTFELTGRRKLAKPAVAFPVQRRVRLRLHV